MRKSQGFQCVFCWPSGRRIPAFEFVIGGFEFLELGAVKVPVVDAYVIPFSVSSAGKVIVRPFKWNLIDVVGLRPETRSTKL